MSIKGFLFKHFGREFVSVPKSDGSAGQTEMLVYEQCGRCKNFCEKTIPMTYHLDGFSKWNNLCPHCKDSFDKWWGKEEK